MVAHHPFTFVGSPKVFTNVVTLATYLDIDWLYKGCLKALILKGRLDVIRCHLDRLGVTSLEFY